MKKLKLKALELGSNELLTREQLKNVMAGDGSGGGSGGGGTDLHWCCKIGSTVGQNQCSGCSNQISECPTGYKLLLC